MKGSKWVSWKGSLWVFEGFHMGFLEGFHKFHMMFFLKGSSLRTLLGSRTQQAAMAARATPTRGEDGLLFSPWPAWIMGLS